MTTEDRELFEKLCVATSAKGDSTWQQNVTWARVGLEAIRAAEGEATAPVTLTIRDAPPMHVGSFTYSAKTGEWESPRTSHLVAEVEALTEELSSWKRRATEAESRVQVLQGCVDGLGKSADILNVVCRAYQADLDQAEVAIHALCDDRAHRRALEWATADDRDRWHQEALKLQAVVSIQADQLKALREKVTPCQVA